jgi:hypothetical protein
VTQARQLKSVLEAKVQEIRDIVAKVDEEKAAREPAPGEWCVKEVLSHLAGGESRDFVKDIKQFLEEETPRIDVHPGVSFYDDARKSKTASELLSEIESIYGQIGEYIGNLSDEQVGRKANVPLFKETPLGEYPTLAQWIGVLVNFHMNAHVQQLRDLCR